ncbi:hypothetical protein QYM36_009958 [Artemia franciscana]|uniref:Uncharacterized protein n=1 Tax=Artemia franciscana TaxID=6661 RepID=A0AA88L183_ARTSF|nr:hypothetical protein QYM36_009958 [Artemia franciscana]
MPEVIRPFPKAGPRSEKPRGHKKLCSKILTDTPEKERFEAKHQIKEAKMSKKKSRAGRKGAEKRNITADPDEEEDFVHSNTSSNENLHIKDTEGMVLAKDKIEDEIEVLFWKRIFPSYKFQEMTEKGRFSLEDALMKLPKPILSGGTARQASLHTFGVDFSGFSVL